MPAPLTISPTAWLCRGGHAAEHRQPQSADSRGAYDISQGLKQAGMSHPVRITALLGLGMPLVDAVTLHALPDQCARSERADPCSSYPERASPSGTRSPVAALTAL